MKSLGLVLIVLLLFLSFCLYVPRVKAAWLEGWNKRIRIDIDSGDIDTSLSSFPVLIHLSNDSSGIYNENVSCVFDELGTNYLKIAVTVGEDQETFIEVEQWVPDLEIAFLWANVTANDSTNTTLYLYYDINHANNTAYVDVTGTGNSVYVWDTDFKGVYHMRDNTTSTTADSTRYDEDAIKGAVNQPLTTEAGAIDGAQYFDGSNDGVTSVVSGVTGAVFTVEAWVELDNYFGATEEDVTSGQGGDGTGRYAGRIRYYGPGDYYQFTANRNDGGPTVSLADNDVHYLAGVCNLKERRLYLDSDAPVENIQANDGWFDVDRYFGRQDRDGRYYDGIIDELRFSIGERNASWIGASYESGLDDLLDYGAEEALGEVTYNITFYHTNGGNLSLDCVIVANGTQTEYANNTIIELIAIVNGNLTYGFDNFTWNGNYNYSNPYNYTVAYGLTNLTLWCYYQPFGVITIEERAFGTLGFVVAVIAVAIGGAILGKKIL